MKISIFGDVMLGRKVAQKVNEGVSLLSEVSSAFGTESFKVCNLESPLISGTPSHVERLYATTKALDIIKQFDGVTLANNHIFDQGLKASFETIDLLDRCGIKHTGVGSCKSEAFEPIIADLEGKLVAILGITSRSNISLADHDNLNHIALIEDDNRINEFISKYKNEIDLLIVLPHMGVEHVDCPSEFIRKSYYNLIDRGFDMVIASHPHVVQGIEYYKGKIICYSLGDFIFDNLNKLRRTSLFVDIDLSRNQYPHIRPVMTRKDKLYRPRLINASQTDKTLARLNGYLGNKHAYRFRFFLCKLYNQVHILTQAARSYGVKGIILTVKAKVKLLVRG